jgi:hypothetical protein
MRKGMDSPLAKRFFITENLAVHDEDGEESEKSFFASTGLEISEDVPLCRMQA